MKSIHQSVFENSAQWTAPGELWDELYRRINTFVDHGKFLDRFVDKISGGYQLALVAQRVRLGEKAGANLEITTANIRSDISVLPFGVRFSEPKN